MISPKVLRFPERTFKGRQRVSLVPRWISMWSVTLVMLYACTSYLLRMFGMPAPTLDSVVHDFRSSPTVTAQVMSMSTPLPSSFRSSSGGGFSDPVSVASVVQQDVQVTFTPYPTYTPFPTQRPVVGRLMAVGYSYYWPPFGPPNCSDLNWHADLNFCDDTTASGLRWTLYVGVAVAVPLEYREFILLGATVRVHSPSSMVGDYLVIDYCGSCIKEEGHIYFDFLDNRQRLAWTVPMLVEILP